MIALLYYIALIVLIFASATALSGAVGIVMGRLIHIDLLHRGSLYLAPWLGLGCAIVFLEIWHFVFPVKFRSSGCSGSRERT